MEVMHTFMETESKDMKAHLENWFGVVPMELENPETCSYLACYCGAWLVPMQFDKHDDITVGAVWHQRRFKNRES
jgi:hypothetical protein